MFHVEIRRDKNGGYGAYWVDHSSSIPDKFLFGDEWEKDPLEIFNSDEDSFYLSLVEKPPENRVIRFGIKESGVGGNPDDQQPTTKGVLFGENDNILGIVIGLFNAAPGNDFLKVFTDKFNSGVTEPRLADNMAAHPFFIDHIIDDKMTTTTKVEVLMSHYGLTADNVPGSPATKAQAFFTNSINSNVGFGEIATEATFFLLGNRLLGNGVPEMFIEIKRLLELKILAAKNYSQNNPSVNQLKILQEPLLEKTIEFGTDKPDNLTGSLNGSVIWGKEGHDIITLRAQDARDVVVLKNGTDSQIFDANGDGRITFEDISKGKNVFLPDRIINFKLGEADTADRIDVSNFNFSGVHIGLLDLNTTYVLAKRSNMTVADNPFSLLGGVYDPVFDDVPSPDMPNAEDLKALLDLFGGFPNSTISTIDALSVDELKIFFNSLGDFPYSTISTIDALSVGKLKALFDALNPDDSKALFRSLENFSDPFISAYSVISDDDVKEALNLYEDFDDGNIKYIITPGSNGKIDETTDFTDIPDLFYEPNVGNRGLAFFNNNSSTFLFVDANKDGDFTAADDILVELQGVSNLTESSFIFL